MDTSTTNICADSFAASSKAKVSHIIKGESKGISYHAFSLSYPLPLLLPPRQGERKQSVGTQNQTSDLELIVQNLCLVAYLALLSSARLQLLGSLEFPQRILQDRWQDVSSLH